MRYWLIIICTFCVSVELTSQQLPLFTQYSEYQAIINPSSVSYSYYRDGYDLIFGTSYRDQWNAVPDRPRTFAIRAESFHAPQRGAGFVYGGYVIHDQAGPFKTTGITGRVASMIRFSGDSFEEGAISLGLNFGLNQYRADLADFLATETDPSLLLADAGKVFPDVGVGLSMYKQTDRGDYYSFGISVPQLFGLNLSLRNADNGFDIKRTQHYYAHANYYLVMGQQTYMQLSMWVKKVNDIPVNADINYRYKFSNNVWFGLGYNTTKLLHAEAGVVINNSNLDKRVKIGYAYNASLETLGISFGSTHELNVSYLIDRN